MKKLSRLHNDFILLLLLPCISSLRLTNTFMFGNPMTILLPIASNKFMPYKGKGKKDHMIIILVLNQHCFLLLFCSIDKNKMVDKFFFLNKEQTLGLKCDIALHNTNKRIATNRETTPVF